MLSYGNFLKFCIFLINKTLGAEPIYDCCVFFNVSMYKTDVHICAGTTP